MILGIAALAVVGLIIAAAHASAAQSSQTVESMSTSPQVTSPSGLDPITVFAQAIKSHEGWYPGSRSYRNNNPGNLRPPDGQSNFWAGQIGVDDGGYAIFDGYESGWAALYGDVSRKFSGNTVTGLGPSSTIADFFSVYSPASDNNNVAAYAADVAQFCSAKLGADLTAGSTLAEVQAA